MNNFNDVCYTRCVMELAGKVPVITSQAIFSVTGIKLLNSGVRLNSSFFERLANHNLLPPLEQCLQVENGVSHETITKMAGDMVLREPALRRLAQTLPDIAMWLAPLQKVNLSEPVQFLLTLAREQRPRLLSHSVRVALLSSYIGLRLGMSMQHLTVLASAGLFHDLGELRIDEQLLNPQHRLTPDERKLLRTHPNVTQHILLNAAAYPMEIVNAVIQHHEHMDGSGYPFGLGGSEMTRYGRVLSLAEAVASKLDTMAAMNETALEFMLKLNAHQFDENLLSIMSVLYAHGDDGRQQHKSVDINVSVPYLHNEIEKIGLALNYWLRLLDKTAVAPRSAAAFIQQRLARLALVSRAAGINPADKRSLTAGIEEDAGSLLEVKQLSQEALQQIRETVYEVHRRWPDYPADSSEQGAVVQGWMEHMEELLLSAKERVLQA
jgi:HD-GYP domain-containing protein (c-di-GMP phosphodiesterase class II)